MLRARGSQGVGYDSTAEQQHMVLSTLWGFPGGTSGKEPTANAGNIRDSGSTPGSGRFSGVENGNLLQYSCLENPMDRGLEGYHPWGCKVGHD